MSLPPEQAASYGAIIDLILAKSDLEKISAKAVRRELAERLGYDVSAQKEHINLLINERFDKISNGVDATANASVEPLPTKNGTSNGVVKSIEQPATPISDAPQSAQSSPAKRKEPSTDSELSEPIDEPKPKKKKMAKASTTEDDDAAFAARLQAEENSRARPTRGGGPKKRAPPKKDKGAAKKKKKSAAKIKADDDSDVESGSDDEPKERKGGFHKKYTLSEPLAVLVGETELSRPQTVKKIWEYVRAQDLQDPSDKRQIRCDDAMRAVFKQDKVHMFTMNKILGQNLYAQDE